MVFTWKSIFIIFHCILYQPSTVQPVPFNNVKYSTDVGDNDVVKLYEERNRMIRSAPSTDLEQKKWPNNTVYYEIDEKLSPIRNLIVLALNEVERVSCIRYNPRNNQTIDYVRFQSNSSCLEPVGRQGGLQTVDISIPDCGVYGFFIHAAMQILGFHHEHQRFDRDEHIIIKIENAQPEFLWAFDKLNSTSHYYNSPYDVDSIMQYGSFQFSKNGLATVTTLNGGLIESWGEKARLSRLDIIAINDYYKC